MGIRMIKKAGEALANLKTFKKDLVYVPEFTNTKALQELVDDIHTMYQNGEEGWDGDAVNFTSNPHVLESSDYPYLLVVGGDFAESMFAFQSESDRDCIVSDYLRDPDLMGESKGSPAAGNEAAEKGFDFYVKSVKKAFPDWPAKVINMVAEWYYNENAADDFSTIGALASHIQNDLPDMLDSADDASYIRQVIADTNQSDLPRKVRKALKKVFPSYKYHTCTVDDDYMCVEYLEDNLIPEDAYWTGLEELEKLLPGITVSDGGWHYKRQIEFQHQF